MTYWQSAGGTRDAGAGDDDARDRVFPDLTGQPHPPVRRPTPPPETFLYLSSLNGVAGELARELQCTRSLAMGKEGEVLLPTGEGSS